MIHYRLIANFALILLTCNCSFCFAQDAVVLRGHRFPIWSLAYSPDGKELCSAGEDGRMVIWDVKKKREKTVMDDQDWPSSLVYSVDGKKLIGARAKVKIWDTASKKSTVIYDDANAGMERSVAVSLDGKLLAAGGRDHTIKLWDYKLTREIESIAGHEGNISSVAFSPNGKLLASGSFDGTIRVWDLSSKKETAKFSGYKNMLRSVLFMPDSNGIVSGSWDGNVKVWDLETKKVKLTLKHEDVVFAVAISPNKKVIATGCANKQVNLWNAQTGENLLRMQHSSMVLALAFSPDGNFLAVAGGNIIDGREPCEVQLIEVSRFM